MPERLKELGRRGWSLVVDTASSAGEDDVARMAAAMAYWLLVTLASVAFVLSIVASWLLSKGIEGTGPLARLVDSGAIDLSTLMGGSLAFAGPLAPALAAVLVLVGATAVFGQFVGAINVIWKEPTERGAAYQFIRHNLLAFLLMAVFTIGAIVALTGTLVLAQVLAVAASVIEAAGGQLPPADPNTLIGVTTSVLTAWAMFTVAFWVVPQRSVRLVDVLPGSALTAVAYQVGASIMAAWLPTTSKFNIYGVFGAFVAVVVFIYYVSYIALVGVEFTRQWILRAEDRRDRAAGHST